MKLTIFLLVEWLYWKIIQLHRQLCCKRMKSLEEKLFICRGSQIKETDSIFHERKDTQHARGVIYVCVCGVFYSAENF